MYDVVVKKFTFAVSSRDELLAVTFTLENVYYIQETCFVGEVDDDVIVRVSTAGPDAAQKIDDGTAGVAQKRLIVAVFHANEHHEQLSTPDHSLVRIQHEVKPLTTAFPSLNCLITCEIDNLID